MMIIMLIYTKDDEQYVAGLYLELKDDMLYVANKILRNHDDAEDAVHLAFVNIIKGLQRIQSLQNVNSNLCRETAAYCIVIVKNVSRRIYNKRKTRQTTPIEDFENTLVADDNPVEQALNNNLLKLIDEAIKGLPEKLAKAFVLRYYKGMKHSEIGEFMNVTTSTAQKRVERATDIILKQIGEEAI
ncbi:MAG TPA: hypothetical protein DEQ02_07240 [Ruminococcaceae bacterium]|nr:hypothetical protein [Oscillospiraceae bacterium]